MPLFACILTKSLFDVSRYVLGAVFLQLCQLLSLGEHNIIKRPVDPTLFIPRFTESKFLVTSVTVNALW